MRYDGEIKSRLATLPNYIARSRSNSNLVAKANLTSNVFRLAKTSWAPALFPEFKGKTIVTLVFDMKSLVPELERPNLEKAYSLLVEMDRLSREDYYIHDMYKMDATKLSQIEDVAEKYLKKLQKLRSYWK